MDTREAIRQVRVVRRYRPDTLPESLLTDIIDAGRHAGSSKNQQRWGFIVVRERDTLKRLGGAGPFAGHVPGAGAVVALVTPGPVREQPLSVMWDLGRAAQNMVLAAWEMGIGSCPVTVYEHELVSGILGLPADRHCEYLLAFGWADDPDDLVRPPRAGGRLKLEEILHRERW